MRFDAARKRATRRRVYADLLTHSAPSPTHLRRALRSIVKNDGIAFDGMPGPADFGRKVAQLVDTGMTLVEAIDVATDALGRCTANVADMAGWSRWKAYRGLADFEKLSPARLRQLGSRVVDIGATMGFGTLTQWAAQSKAPSAHRAVGAMIAGHVPDKRPYGPAWPSIERLSELTGKSKSNVKRSIAALVESGELTVAPRQAPPDRRGNVYRLVWHKAPESPPTDSTTEDGESLLKGPQSKRSEGLLARGPEPADRTSREPTDRTGTEGNRRNRILAPATPKRDELFDTLAEVCGIDPSELTRSARGALNRALADLRAVGATPDEIRARSAQHRRKWPNIAVTAPSLAKHWPELTVPNRGRWDEGVRYR